MQFIRLLHCSEWRRPWERDDNKFKMAAYFWNGNLLHFQRIVVDYQLNIPCKYFEVSTNNTLNEHFYCQVVKQNVFKDVCEYEANCVVIL